MLAGSLSPGLFKQLCPTPVESHNGKGDTVSAIEVVATYNRILEFRESPTYHRGMPQPEDFTTSLGS